MNGQPKRYIIGHVARKYGPEATERRLSSGYTVDLETGCWLWDGPLDEHGYAYLKVAGQGKRAHRVMYERHKGPIPDGLEIDHVKARGCRYRHCVNPDHMEPVTTAENQHRGNAAKLTWEAVRFIRQAPASVSTYVLARQFGVSPSAVGFARRGDTWKE